MIAWLIAAYIIVGLSCDVAIRAFPEAENKITPFMRASAIFVWPLLLGAAVWTKIMSVLLD